MAKSWVVRFGVRSSDGRSSTIWRVWQPSSGTKSDIYLANRHVAHQFKVSLHESGDWRSALVSEKTRGQIPEFELETVGKRLSKWDRPAELLPGLTLAFRIVVPEQELGVFDWNPFEADNVYWVDNPNAGHIVEFSLLFSRGSSEQERWPGEEKGTSLVSSTQLPNGQMVWLVRSIYPAADGLVNLIEIRKAEAQRRFKTMLATRSKKNLRYLLFTSDQDEGAKVFIETSI